MFLAEIDEVVLVLRRIVVGPESVHDHRDRHEEQPHSRHAEPRKQTEQKRQPGHQQQHAAADDGKLRSRHAVRGRGARQMAHVGEMVEGALQVVAPDQDASDQECLSHDESPYNSEANRAGDRRKPLRGTSNPHPSGAGDGGRASRRRVPTAHPGRTADSPVDRDNAAMTVRRPRWAWLLFPHLSIIIGASVLAACHRLPRVALAGGLDKLGHFLMLGALSLFAVGFFGAARWLGWRSCWDCSRRSRRRRRPGSRRARWTPWIWRRTSSGVLLGAYAATHLARRTTGYAGAEVALRTRDKLADAPISPDDDQPDTDRFPTQSRP